MIKNIKLKFILKAFSTLLFENSRKTLFFCRKKFFSFDMTKSLFERNKKFPTF